MMDWDSVQITVLHDDGVVVMDEYSYSLKAEQRMIIFGGEPGPMGPQGPQGPQGPAGPSGSGSWGTISGDIADQTDLMNALNAKANTADLGALATQDTVDYQTEVTNKPSLGSMAAVNDAPSDDKEYARKNGAWSEVAGGGGTWGSITGTLSDQTDLQNALDAKANADSIAPAFSTSTQYVVGDYCYYNGTLYRFKSVHSAGAWDASDVTAVTVGEQLFKGELYYYTSVTVSVATSALIMRIPTTGYATWINADTVVLDCVIASPSSVTSNISWTSYAGGYIEFTGTCVTATTANVIIGKKSN